MSGFLLTLLRLSLLGSLLAAGLFLLKPLMRGRVSRSVQYYLWLLVLLRLCIPAGVTLSLPERETPVQTPAAVAAEPVSRPAVPAEPAQAAPTHPVSQTEAPTPEPLPTPQRGISGGTLLTLLWATGGVLLAGWYGLGYARLCRAVRRSAAAPDPEALTLLGRLDPDGRVRLVESAAVSTPLLLGVVHPTIVLPLRTLDRRQLADVLAHEATHARRQDLLYKWFAVLTVCLHWFNPVVHLVRREIGRACELACDEAVVRGLDDSGRRHYGETLLSMAAQTAPSPLLLAMCQEKKNLKERLVSIVKLRKRTPLTLLLTAALVAAVAGCALVSNAARKEPAAPGLVNTATKTTVELGMTKAEVEAVLGEPEYEQTLWLNGHGEEYGFAEYGKDVDKLHVEYADEHVAKLEAADAESMQGERPHWAVKAGAAYGSSRKAVERKHGETLDSGGDTWSYWDEGAESALALYGNDADGVFWIILERADAFLDQPDLPPDPVAEDAPTLIDSTQDNHAAWLGMTKAELGARFGWADIRGCDPEYADYYGNPALMTYYDYSYAWPEYPLLAACEGDNVVQILASYKGAFCVNRRDEAFYTQQDPDYELQIWTTPRGITVGSTLADIQAKYDVASVSQDNNPKWFGVSNTEPVTTVTVDGDGYVLLFWLTDAEGVFGFCLSADGTPLPVTNGEWPL